MSNTDKGISILEIEEIKYKSDMIAGLSAVFVVFFKSMHEDDIILGAFECLKEEAFRLQDKCTSLLNKFENSRY